MTGAYSIDLISDLNLSAAEQFDWTGKPTSLFCVIAGGISNKLEKTFEALEHLSTLYRGVFYIDGTIEHREISDHKDTVKEITKFCKPYDNIIYMHNNVVKLNNIALVGINGWHWKDYSGVTFSDRFRISNLQNEDLSYLSTTLRNLQLHDDVEKVVVVSSTVPYENLFYGRTTDIMDDEIAEPAIALIMDTQHKVKKWLYGGTELINDYVYSTCRYVANPRIQGQPYWPKAITI